MRAALLDRPLVAPPDGIDGILDSLCRRPFVLAGTAAAMVAACGDDAVGPSDTPATQVVRPASGDASVPARPQRIPAAVAGMQRVSRDAYPTSCREAMVLIDQLDTLLGELESGE